MHENFKLQIEIDQLNLEVENLKGRLLHHTNSKKLKHISSKSKVDLLSEDQSKLLIEDSTSEIGKEKCMPNALKISNLKYDKSIKSYALKESKNQSDVLYLNSKASSSEMTDPSDNSSSLCPSDHSMMPKKLEAARSYSAPEMIETSSNKHKY